jgi:hypothetical protein
MIISVCLFVLAGILDAIMDVITTKWSSSIFNGIKNTKLRNWANPVYSWPNKWKNGDYSQGERFFGSSTFLVWLTDLWHLSKTLMLFSICLGAVLFTIWINIWLDLALLYLAYTLTFQLFYGKIFIK